MNQVKINLGEVFLQVTVIGRKNFVGRLLVDKLLSKNFRRHNTSSVESDEAQK